MARTTKPRVRKPPETGDALGLGLVLGGLGLLALAALSSDQKPQRPRLIVGGVDLTNVDTSKPFTANFSVPSTASASMKSQALHAASQAVNAFELRGCLVQFTEIDAVQGRFVILVTPLGGPILG